MPGEFDLETIVPWGREAWEYETFFRLGEAEHRLSVLDCGGGPSSFTAEWAAHGRTVTATDPLYAAEPEEITRRFDEVEGPMLEGMRSARERFVWRHYRSPEGVVEHRRRALARFLADYDDGRAAGRYVEGALPHLPFDDRSFDLVLSSHLLFLYSDDLDADAHLAALTEMLRVGDEARIFPLLDMVGRVSRHVDPVVDGLIQRFRVERVAVPFEFQRGATEMLLVRHP